MTEQEERIQKTSTVLTIAIAEGDNTKYLDGLWKAYEALYFQTHCLWWRLGFSRLGPAYSRRVISGHESDSAGPTFNSDRNS